MDKKTVFRIIFSIATVLYAILLLMISSTVKPNTVFPDGSLDLPAHIAGFLVLTALIFITFNFHSINKNKALWLTAGLSAVLSVIVEILRIPGRGFSFGDLGFDLIGVLLGVAASWIFSKR